MFIMLPWVTEFFSNMYLLLFRVTATTKMNDVSSRSHAIFTLVFTQVSIIVLYYGTFLSYV